MYSCIKTENPELGIGVIKLHRPSKQNALSIQMRREYLIAFRSGNK